MPGRGPPRRRLQSAVRRQADAVREARRRPHQRRVLQRQRLRDLGRFGLAAHRERQGQDRSRRPKDCSRRCTQLLTRDDVDDRRGQPRQARRAVRRPRVPGPREVREPLLAHARRGAAPAANRFRPNNRRSTGARLVPSRQRTRELHPRRGRGDRSCGRQREAAPGPAGLHHAGPRRQLHRLRRGQPLPHRGQGRGRARQGAGGDARTAAECERRRREAALPGSR